MSRLDHLEAIWIIGYVVGHSSVSLAFDYAVLGPDQVLHRAVRASQVVSDTLVGLHFVSAVLVRADLEMDFLCEAAHFLLESVARHHLEVGLAVDVHLVPVQHVAGEVDQP